MTNKEVFNWEEALLTKEFMEFPEELNKKCTEEEFHEMMTSQINSDIPIERVTFLDYPDITEGLNEYYRNHDSHLDDELKVAAYRLLDREDW